MPMPDPEVYLLSLSIGILTGAIGVGGFLIIPVLQFLGQLTAQDAVATALFCFLLAAAPGVFLSRRLFRIDRVAVLVCVGALFAGYAGARLNYLLPPAVSRLILGCVLVVAAGFGFLRLRAQDAAAGPAPEDDGRPGGIYLGVGVTTGLLSGMTGVGGPVIAVPLLGVLRVHPGTILACAQLVTLVGSASATVGNIALGAVSYPLGIGVGIVLAIGLCIGLVIAKRLVGRRFYPYAVAWATLFSGLYFLFLAYQ